MSRSIPQLKISITPSLTTGVQKWLERYNDSDLGDGTEPSLVRDCLAIDAYAISDFIRLATEYESNQLDLARFRKSALNSIDAAIQRARSERTIDTLKYVRTLVLSAVVGEFGGKPVKFVRKPFERLTKV